MILGTLQYTSRYGGLGDGVQKALKFLASHELWNLPLGRYVIEGDSVFMEILETSTVVHNSKLFEAHQKYIDLHLTLLGEEWYGYAPINNLVIAEQYDDQKDLAWYKGEGVYFQVPQGQFVLFFPEDAHKPCITFKESTVIRKLIVKIKA